MASQGSWRKLEGVEKGPRPGCISSHFRAQYLAGQRSEAPKSSIWNYYQIVSAGVHLKKYDYDYLEDF